LVSNVIHALLVTSDPRLVMNFTKISKELSIDTQTIANSSDVPEELRRTKYEAVLFDFDTAPATLPMVNKIRENPSNQRAVIFAVASDLTRRRQALQQGTTFLLERPFEIEEIRRLLYTAYELMARERRRYFRCAANLPVLIIKINSGTDLRCRTINVSSNGMALTTASSLNLGEEIQIVFSLPRVERRARARGIVVWDDKHGKTDVSFQCADSRDQRELNLWLDAQFRGSAPHASL
jgi:CheY-like chemotaxis protein